MLWMTQIPRGAQQNGASDCWGPSDPFLSHLFSAIATHRGKQEFCTALVSSWYHTEKKISKTPSP